MRLSIKKKALTKGQQSLLECSSRQVLLAGGYGSGKTTGICLKILQLKSVNNRAPGVIIAPTMPLLKAVTLRRFLKIWSSVSGNKIKPIDPMGENYLDLGDGAPIFLRSATRPDSIDGLDVGWAVGDEIRYWSKEAYDITLGRVRVPCKLPQKAFGSTPSMGWMAEEFNTGKQDRELITSGTKDNPHLAHGFIENLRKSYSPRMQKAVIEGQFTILEGAVYEDFDPSPDSPWFVDLKLDQAFFAKHRIFLAVDPGYRRSAYLWIAETGPLEWTVFDQMMPENTADSACVEMVNAKGYPIDEVWVDPAGDATQSAMGLDTFAIFRGIKPRRQGTRLLRCITGPYRHIPFGVDKLRVLLGGIEGLPIRIKFDRRVLIKERGKKRGIVKDLASLRYPELKDGRAITDMPLKDGLTDHSCDSLRYFAVGRWMVDKALRAKDPDLVKSKHEGYRVA